MLSSKFETTPELKSVIGEEGEIPAAETITDGETFSGLSEEGGIPTVPTDEHGNPIPDPDPAAKPVLKEEGTEETPPAAAPADAPAADPNKAAEEEPKKPEPTAETGAIPEVLAKAFPDVKNPDEIVAKFNEVNAALTEEREANAEIVQILNEHPAIMPILKGLRAGKPLYDVLANVLDQKEPVPDKVKDPEGYDRYVRNAIRQEEKLKQLQQEEKKAQERAKKIEEHGLSLRKNFQAKQKLSDTDMDRFLSNIKKMFYPDPETGLLPDDYLDRLAVFLNHETIVQDEKQKAEIAARNAAIDKLKKEKELKGQGDKLPSMRGGAPGPVSETTEWDPFDAIVQRPSRIFGS